ncbi:MAG: hypothetical protein AB7V50_03960 [Vampirovibrionia bacterium]
MENGIQGPSTFQIKKYILDKTPIVFKLINNEFITGTILWHDDRTVYIETKEKENITLTYQSILYYKTE